MSKSNPAVKESQTGKVRKHRKTSPRARDRALAQAKLKAAARLAALPSSAGAAGKTSAGKTSAGKTSAGKTSAGKTSAGKTGADGTVPKTPVERAKARAASPRSARRSFSLPVLATEAEGPLAELLSAALQTPTEGGYEGVHGFHPYPGRYHHHLPRTVLKGVLEGMPEQGSRVLDPFMGGGTTLVEALRLGMQPSGNDLNPVALLVARERTRPRTAEQARRLEGEAARIAAQVEALRREKNPPRVAHRRQTKLSPHYPPHVLAELMQWWRLIDAMPAGPSRETLRAVFSAAVVKFSNLASDSRAEPANRAEPPNQEAGEEPLRPNAASGSKATPQGAPAVPKGAAGRFLVAKCKELMRAQVQLAKEIPRQGAEVRLLNEDARLLPEVGWGEFDHIMTSPPYPGVYDYYQHHRLRIDWLGLEGSAFESAEIGTRRRGTAGVTAGGTGGGVSWSEDLRDVLLTLARVLRPGGNLFLVLGDWMADGHAVDARMALTRTATAKGWQVASWASVQRPVYARPERKAYARKGRWEHLLQLTRPGGRKSKA